MKIWDTQKFNKEISALRKLKREKQTMHPLLKEQIKQKVLFSLPEQETKPKVLPIKLRLLRYGAGLLAALSASAGTVYAASSSLPGDKLYPVKQIKEEVEIKVAVTPQAKAEVQAKHAKERIREVVVIKEKVEQAKTTKPAEALVQKATSVTENVKYNTASPADPVRGGTDITERRKKAQRQAEIKATAEINGALKDLRETREKMKRRGDDKQADKLEKEIQEIRKNAKGLNLLQDELDMKKDRKDKKIETDNKDHESPEEGDKLPTSFLLNPKR